MTRETKEKICKYNDMVFFPNVIKRKMNQRRTAFYCQGCQSFRKNTVDTYSDDPASDGIPPTMDANSRSLNLLVW